MKINVILTSLILVVLLQFSTHLLNAQNMHIVGDGATETNYPPNTQVFSYNWSSMIYTSEEMGEAKTVTKIAFDQSTDYGSWWETAVLEDQKIYMKHFSGDEFTTLAYEDPTNPTSGYTLVFDGTIQFCLGWSAYELFTPFEYDGTSSVVVHYENHRGSTAPIINVKFTSTENTNNVFKACGNDNQIPFEFGTFVPNRPNIAFYYQGEGPATPANPSPANNSIKALVDTEVAFIIGANTTSYDLYFGTTNPPTTLVAEDITVNGAGEYSQDIYALLNEYLLPHNEYFWQVVAKDGTSITNSEVWSFTTQGYIGDFPYSTSFEDRPIRTIFADSTDWNWPLAGAPNWGMNDYYTHTGEYAVLCNVWAIPAEEYSLVTPRIFLPDNYRISFWWTLHGSYSQNVNVYFEATNDGGENWQTLKTFDLSGGVMDEYVQEFISLTDFVGNNTYLRFRYDKGEGYVADYFSIDDLSIEALPTGSVIQIENPTLNFPKLAQGGQTYLPLAVSNVGSIDLVIDGATLTAPYSIETPVTIPPMGTETVNIYFDGSSIGVFEQDFSFTGNFSNTVEAHLSGEVYEIAYNFFENGDYSLDLPENWSVIRTSMANDLYTNVTIEQTNYDAYSVPNAFRMLKMNDISSPLILVTEGVGGFGENKLSFWAKKGYDSYNATLVIGLTDDPIHASAFMPIETYEMTTTYTYYEVEFASTNTLPYLAFKFEGGEYAAGIWMDDLSWDMSGSYPPYCPVLTFPEPETVDVDIMMDLELNWSSGGGNPTGYKLSIGTNPEANNILDSEDLGNVLSYSFPVEPTYNTLYFWKVVAYNSFGESEGCSIEMFTTMDDPTVNVPWSENFDSWDAFGAREYPLGWSIENSNEDNFPWDFISDVATSGVAHSTPNAMHMVFSLNEMDDWLFAVPMNLEAEANYELSFWCRTMGDAWVPEPVERLGVKIGTANNSSAMTTEIYDNQNLNYLNWQQQTASFSVESDGVYFIGFHGYSLPNQGLLLVDDVVVDFQESVSEIADVKAMLYPNPAKSTVQISTNSTIKSVEVFNTSGLLSLKQECKTTSLALNVAELSIGIYYVKLNTTNGVIVKKLIIQ